MSLSRHSLEILMDLIEIKINALQVQDRDDARELSRLRKCRQELMSLEDKALTRRTRRFRTPSTYTSKATRGNRKFV